MAIGQIRHIKEAKIWRLANYTPDGILPFPQSDDEKEVLRSYQDG